MNCSEILAELKIRASEKYKANAVRMGIPEQYSLGVSTVEVRSLAKRIQKSNELALELWVEGYHEARMLAVLLMKPKEMTKDTVEQLIGDVISWDLCDHLCKNLLIKMDCRSALIEGWITSPQTYRKRAAFTLIASAVIHDKKLTNDMLDHYLELIAQYSDDGREHVKKAASCALREIGKRDFNYNEKALLIAQEFAGSDSKVLKWIGKDSIRELETMVKTEGRGRLISSKSHMGKEVARRKIFNELEAQAMQRSMMQVYVKGSVEAVELYRAAFDADVLCTYPDENGGYMHSELNAHGQVIAVSEIAEDVIAGNTMMFCFHFGAGGEENVRKAYEVLKEGARSHTPIGPCDYSPCQFTLTDRFGVCWCVFV